MNGTPTRSTSIPTERAAPPWAITWRRWDAPLDDIKYSLMTRVIYRQTQAQLDAFLHECGVSDGDVAAGKMIVGTAAEVVDQIGARAEAGVERIMLRWLELDDMANLGAAGARCAAAINLSAAAEKTALCFATEEIRG